MRIYCFVHYFARYFLGCFTFLSLALSISYAHFIDCSPSCMAHSHEHHDYRPLGTCLCPCSTEKEGRCVPGRQGQACGHRLAAGYGANVSPVVIVGALTSMSNGGAGKSSMDTINVGQARSNTNLGTAFWDSPDKQLKAVIRERMRS